MLKSYWLFVPFLVQTLFMGTDEFWCHRKRGLPRWERIGHPIDTLTVVLCLVWILCVRPDRQTVTVFFALAVFSCIFITKDEPVHKRCCSAAELWLHAILFMLHPIALASAGILWPAIWGGSPYLFPWMAQPLGFERAFLTIICTLMVVFGMYQVIFWNLLWHPKKSKQ